MMERDLKSNCFDVLRLLLALMVVYSHGVLLGGLGVEQFKAFTKGQTIAGHVAVLGFFGLSGYLVTMSFLGGGSRLKYVRSRLLRILPGYYLAILLTAFLFAPLIAKFNSQADPWSVAAASRYIIDNLFVRVGNWHVGQVLIGLPYDMSINGSLWSLFPELCCYGLVFIAGCCGLLATRGINLVLWIFIFFILHLATILKPDDTLVAPTLMTLTKRAPFILAFTVGAACFVYRDLFSFGGWKSLPWCLSALLLLKLGGWAIASPIVLPITLLHIGYCVKLRLPADYSYGIYLLHFPVFHLLSAWGVNRAGAITYLSLGTLITIILASLSWHVVERPFLRMKRFSPTV